MYPGLWRSIQLQRKSCAKTVLVNVYSKNCRQKRMKVYAVIDDESNKTLASVELFDLMRISDKLCVIIMCRKKTNIWSENWQSGDWIYWWTYFCWAAICYWMWTNSKCSRWNTNTRNCSPLWTLTWDSRLHSTYRQQSWNHDAYWKRHNYSTSCTWSESRTWQSSLCTEIASWLDYYWWNVSRESSSTQWKLAFCQMVVRL